MKPDRYRPVGIVVGVILLILGVALIIRLIKDLN